MKPEDIANQLAKELAKHGTKKRAIAEKKYLKSDLDFLGVRVPDLRRAVNAAVKTHSEVGALEVAEALWSAPIHERRAAAMLWLEAKEKTLDARAMPVLERMLRESKTWALVDGLAEWVTGPIVERDPSLGTTLDRWAKDEDFWLRRAAMLALLGPMRRGKGKGDFARFARYADAMLEETEFFIRKAIGWILREVSKKDPERVAEWLAPRIDRASGLTIREATKYLPARLKPVPAARPRRRSADRTSRPRSSRPSR